MGLAASLRDSRFVVVGESAGFVPPPALDGVDVLVFDLGEQSADLALLSRSLRVASAAPPASSASFPAVTPTRSAGRSAPFWPARS